MTLHQGFPTIICPLPHFPHLPSFITPHIKKNAATCSMLKFVQFLHETSKRTVPHTSNTSHGINTYICNIFCFADKQIDFSLKRTASARLSYSTVYWISNLTQSVWFSFFFFLTTLRHPVTLQKRLNYPTWDHLPRVRNPCKSTYMESLWFYWICHDTVKCIVKPTFVTFHLLTYKSTSHFPQLNSTFCVLHSQLVTLGSSVQFQLLKKSCLKKKRLNFMLELGKSHTINRRSEPHITLQRV